MRFWGVRGSIPVPGPDTAEIGGNTSCVEVRAGSARLIFDGGTGLRLLGNSLLREMPITADLFFSHVHWDHIQGFPFFGPAFVPGNTIHMYGAANVTGTVETALAGQMEMPNFPVHLSMLPAKLHFHDLHEGEVVSVAEDVRVTSTAGNHPGGVLAYRVEHAGKKRDIWILSDEIYSRLVYGVPAYSIASLPGMLERTIICDGFSKTYAMTGWRLGFGIMPEILAERVELLVTHSVGSTADFTQRAGLAALLGSQELVDSAIETYRHKRNILVEGLNEIPGMTCRFPDGAFYAFPNIKAYGKPSEWLADYLLEEAGVAVLAGASFGIFGEGYLRMCFANSVENIQLAIERLSAAFSKLDMAPYPY